MSGRPIGNFLKKRVQFLANFWVPHFGQFWRNLSHFAPVLTPKLPFFRYFWPQFRARSPRFRADRPHFWGGRGQFWLQFWLRPSKWPRELRNSWGQSENLRISDCEPHDFCELEVIFSILRSSAFLTAGGILGTAILRTLFFEGMRFRENWLRYWVGHIFTRFWVAEFQQSWILTATTKSEKFKNLRKFGSNLARSSFGDFLILSHAGERGAENCRPSRSWEILKNVQNHDFRKMQNFAKIDIFCRILTIPKKWDFGHFWEFRDFWPIWGLSNFREFWILSRAREQTAAKLGWPEFLKIRKMSLFEQFSKNAIFDQFWTLLSSGAAILRSTKSWKSWFWAPGELERILGGEKKRKKHHFWNANFTVEQIKRVFCTLEWKFVKFAKFVKFQVARKWGSGNFSPLSRETGITRDFEKNGWTIFCTEFLKILVKIAVKLACFFSISYPSNLDYSRFRWMVEKKHHFLIYPEGGEIEIVWVENMSWRLWRSGELCAC